MNTWHRLSVAVLLAFAFLSHAPIVANAQGLTGSLTGTVKDQQGGVLRGAVIRVTSTALMTGMEQTTSNDRGQWRFPVLPPGQYVLTIELAPKFAASEEQLSIGAGQSLERSVVLQLAGFSEAVNVEANSGIDSLTSGLETRRGQDFMRSIPTRRNSMFSVINTVPGISPTSPSSGSVNTISVFGSAVNENAFLIDGTNFTCPCQGVSRAEPIVDVIQEVFVQSMGASVEFGNIQGGVFNVVTKQGGARFTGEASYYGQSSGLTAQPIVLPVPRGSQPTSGYERVTYRDFTASVGGPVKRDRLWFFSAYQYLRDSDSQPGADPAHPRAYEQNKIFGKLTWRLTPSMQMMQSFHQEKWVNPQTPTRTIPFEATLRSDASVPSMTFAHITHVVSDRTVWEARAGKFRLNQDDDPSSGDRTTPAHRDAITSIFSVNAPVITSPMLDRVTAKAVLHRYASGSLGADHHVKVGTAYERGEHTLLRMFPGGVQYVDGIAPPQAIFREPSLTGGLFHTVALFASDSFSIKNRITADVGVRYDYNRAISQDLPAVDAEGRETNVVTEGRGTMYTWNLLSPRMGVVLKLDRTGRTLLRSHYGRFYQGVLTGELDPISPGNTITTTMSYDPTTGGYTAFFSRNDPKINQELDPDTRTPHTDEFSLAFDREIAPGVRTSAAYIRKRGGDYIAWIDRGGQYRQETRTLPDGTILPVFALTNSPSARRFFLTNPASQFVHYDGLVVAMEKRMSKGWQASGSYTYSRAYGLQVFSNGPADAPQFSTIARQTALTFGQDPNDLTNATGRLPNDRPHIFRTTGVVNLPWYGILVAGNFQYFSGKPWAATTVVSLPQARDQRILLEPRGSRRLESQSLLDLRIAKTFQVGSAGKVDLIFDVLNVLNDTAAEALASDNRFSPTTFGVPTLFMDPRRAMIGVRLNLGR
jgi:hypothetical protein